ncbi:MAG: hypothetical protein Fur0040_02850 [Sideroxydans sp.]
MDEMDAIQASLMSFTQKLDSAVNDTFNELRKSSFFDPVPSVALKDIARLFTIRTFRTGEQLTREGDEISSCFVILFGQAKVQVHGTAVALIHSGECIGEAAFFATEASSRSATVVAEGEVIAAEIRKRDIGSMTDESRIYMDKALLTALFRKLQQANRKIEELLRSS